MTAIPSRLWSYIEPEPNSGCLLWTGSLHCEGYGQTSWKGRPCSAHRVAWYLTHGELPPRICVLHSCDVRPCINVSHLWTGTKADNNLDRALKGRSAVGELNGLSKLSAADVAEIRRQHELGILPSRLAAEFGVCRSNVQQIVSGTTWKWMKLVEESR